MTAREGKEKANFLRLCVDANKVEENWIFRSKGAGAWATAVPSMKNETVHSKEGCDDTFRYRYGMQPPNLTTHCDGCGDRFSTEHGLNCNHGGSSMSDMTMSQTNGNT